MVQFYGQTVYYKKSMNDERTLKILTSIILYSTKIFCFLTTFYFLWDRESQNLHSSISPTRLSENSFLITRILQKVNWHFVVNVYPAEIFPKFDGTSCWIFVLVAILILVISILGIIGISLDSPCLMIPYIIYRWFFVVMLAGLFFVSFMDARSFIELTRTFSYIPTFIGFMNLFIPVALRVNCSVLVAILEFIIIVYESYLAYIVTRCYETIINRQHRERVENYEEKLHLMLDPPTYYQSLMA